MITYVNSSNASEYSVLFSSATRALLEAGVLTPEKDENGSIVRDDAGLVVAEAPITTIEQYFSYLPNLVALGDAEGTYNMLRSEGRRYTMLPLDEDVLKVDGNARTIELPAAFARNGIAVQGDKYAEIVYFVVDRFFDATDLDTCDIYIQWTNGNGESGVSTPWVVDIESEANKMIVGWALSSDITKYAGTLNFALRFFQWDDKNLSTLKYSWSTLTQSAQIKSSLDFVFGNGKYMIEDEKNEAITNRIINSNTTLAGVAKAEKPEYLNDLEAYADLINNTAYLDVLPTKTEIYPLEVQARSTDGGQISYVWKYIDQYGQEQTSLLGASDDSTDSYVTIEFRALDLPTDTAIEELRASRKLIYQREEDSYVQVSLPDDSFTVQSSTYYERVAVCVATRVGTYYALTTNRLSTKNKAEKKSVLCVIPMPSVPAVEENLTVREILGTKIKTDLVDPSTVSLTVSVTNNETNGTKLGELIYVWYKRRVNADTGKETIGNSMNYKMDEDGRVINIADEDSDWIRIVGADEAELVLSNTAEAMTAPKTIEGHYMVVVYNYKNLKYTNIGSSECRVSYAAIKPVLSYPMPDSDDTKVDLSNTIAVESQIHVDLDSNWTNLWNISDSVSYQWYQTSDDIAVVESDRPLENETNDNFVPTGTGKFYCEVTNHKNETAAKEVSQIFYVV